MHSALHKQKNANVKLGTLWIISFLKALMCTYHAFKYHKLMQIYIYMHENMQRQIDVRVHMRVHIFK